MTRDQLLDKSLAHKARHHDLAMQIALMDGDRAAMELHRQGMYAAIAERRELALQAAEKPGHGYFDAMGVVMGLDLSLEQLRQSEGAIPHA